MRPFDYRPTGADELDWEDNPVSNSIAWVSDKLFPRWCKTETHWTARLANAMWAECACCLFFRGASLGLVLGIVLGTIIGRIF